MGGVGNYQNFILYCRNLCKQLIPLKKFTLIIAILYSLSSCNKSGEDQAPGFNSEYQLKSSPDALPRNDGSNYGVYKGVTISALGTSAAIKFDIYNTGSQPYALFYRDNKIADSLIRYFTDNVGNLARPVQKDTSRILLNGPFYSAQFFSYNNGIGPQAWLAIQPYGLTDNMGVRYDGNYTLNAMLKESSTKQVYCFEGAFSGTDSGRIAFAVSRDSVVAIRSSLWHGEFFSRMSAPVINNQFEMNQVDNVYGITHIFRGKIEDKRCSGTWISVSDSSVTNTFSSSRTL